MDISPVFIEGQVIAWDIGILVEWNTNSSLLTSAA